MQVVCLGYISGVREQGEESREERNADGRCAGELVTAAGNGGSAPLDLCRECVGCTSELSL